jgi:hypothetical protein
MTKVLITKGFIFLGYQVIRSLGGRGKMTPKVLIPESAIRRFQHRVRRIFAPNTTNESMAAKIIAANQLTRGWCAYYRNTGSPPSVFGKLSHELTWEMAHWLAKKYDTSIPKIMRKHRSKVGNYITFGTKTLALVMPDECKARRLLVKTWHNPYTAKEAIAREKILWYDSLWVGTETRKGWTDIREVILLLKGTTCYLCGKGCHPSEVEIDHAMKPRERFKDKTEADRMKHPQPICTECHRKKTKSDLKVLSRMR